MILKRRKKKKKRQQEVTAANENVHFKINFLFSIDHYSYRETILDHIIDDP